jgi:hypothetical protein
MRFGLRWAILAIATALGTASLPGLAHAQTVQHGSFSFSGDPGDWISGGQSYSYATGNNDTLNVFAGTDENLVHLGVRGANGDWWDLYLAAPQGQQLAPGTYTGATRYPFQSPGVPGLDLSGNGRGCNTETGFFTIEDVTFGPFGYVQTLDATFEQHCEGGDAAARGEVHIANPAPPPQLDLGIVVSTSGTASVLNGSATVNGTVTCNKAAAVSLNGEVIEVVRRVLVRGSFSLQLNCTPGKPVPWTARVDPGGTTPYQKGNAEVDSHATGFDSDYGQNFPVNDVTAVRLLRG